MTRLNYLLVGSLAPLGPRNAPSGIRKSPVTSSVHIRREGIEGDAQGDLRVHGGPSKAVHHYAFDHYTWWRAELGSIEALGQPGGFGENLSTTGLTEDDVAIGDVFRLGDATLQVSQSRNPCWKLNARFGLADIVQRVISSGRGGWYYRVLEEGSAAAGDMLERIERPTAEWPLARAWAAMHGDAPNLEDLAMLSTLPTLAPEWKLMAANRLAKLA